MSQCISQRIDDIYVYIFLYICTCISTYKWGPGPQGGHPDSLGLPGHTYIYTHVCIYAIHICNNVHVYVYGYVYGCGYGY